jgi:hypothetical protein
MTTSAPHPPDAGPHGRDRCACGPGETVAVVKHGTRTAYVYHRCRCDLCRAANTAYYREWQAAAAPTYIRHGMESSYKNYGCRCDRCREAAVAGMRARRARAKAHAA